MNVKALIDALLEMSPDLPVQFRFESPATMGSPVTVRYEKREAVVITVPRPLTPPKITGYMPKKDSLP